MGFASPDRQPRLPAVIRLKLGTHYPCARAVLVTSVSNTAREHGCHFVTPAFTGPVNTGVTLDTRVHNRKKKKKNEENS